MSKPRVLQVSIRADRGGGPKHIEAVLRRLQDRFDFFIAAPHEGTFHARFSALALGGVRLPHRHFSLSALVRLMVFIRRWRIDCIHSHGRGAGIYARLAGLLTGVPVVHTHHGVFVGGSGVKRALAVALERALNRLTRRIIFVSGSEMAHCAEAGILDAAKSVVIPNGIDVARADGLRVQPDRSRRPFTLITVSRLEPEKGNHGLLDLVARLRDRGEDFVLHVVGDGGELLALQAFAGQLGVADRVVFLGGRDDVDRLLAGADLFVSCSPGEAQGIAVLEAMLHGLPVVASRVRGHIDTIDNGANGLLFDPDRPEEGAACIARLIADADLARRLGEAGRRTVVERYPEEKMAAAVAEQYEAVIGRMTTFPAAAKMPN